MKIFTKENIIKQLTEIRDKGGISTNRSNNDGCVVNTLEDLLKINENNLPLPNASECELKSQKKINYFVDNIVSYGTFAKRIKICTSSFVT